MTQMGRMKAALDMGRQAGIKPVEDHLKRLREWARMPNSRPDPVGDNVKTTDVFIVLDESSSMGDGAKAQKLRSMVYETADLLAREEAHAAGVGAQRFNIQIIKFSNYVTDPGAPRRPLEIVTGWPGSLDYRPSGMTALRDAIGRALELAERSTAQAKLISIFTDGEENQSRFYSTARLTEYLKKLEAKGDLTVTLAGPASARAQLAQVGIPEGNFQAWDGSEAELTTTAKATVQATQSYVEQRRSGMTSSKHFYADLKDVTPAGIRANTKQVTPTETRVVSSRMAGRTIADFFGGSFKQGSHYYQLVKPEYIQDDKDLVVFIKDAGEYRQGSRSIRLLMGLPETGKIRVRPAQHADKYTIYVQSASNNRKVVEGQTLLTLT